MRFRLAKWAPDRADVPHPDWVQVGAYAKNVLERLEDPSVDGAGLQLRRDLSSGGEGEGEGFWKIEEIDEDGTTTTTAEKSHVYDIEAKSEPWRRGYYEALMLCARAAEHLDDQVVDTTRRLVFPADQVLGPSNPNPKPIAAGSPRAPREEDCERAYEPPEVFYRRVLATNGFTPKQKMDAALEHGAWLDFKGKPDEAELAYRLALVLAAAGERAAAAVGPPTYDEKTYVLRDDGVGKRKPSANVFTCLTALAVHKARAGDVAAALPILVSILRARRSLPSSPQQQQQQQQQSISTNDVERRPASEKTSASSPWTTENITALAKRVLFEPPYPPPPDDGSAPPVRDARGLCEEAGLNLYIGEILYAGEGKGKGKGREDGLAWTRDAVDIAEEQIHKLSGVGGDGGGGGGGGRGKGDIQQAKKTCKECLDAGLENWRMMVEKLAREEREKKKNEETKAAGAGAGKSSWFGLWGESGSEDGSGSSNSVGRWTAEEQVVKERTRRARELLDELETPRTGLGAIFWT